MNLEELKAKWRSAAGDYTRKNTQYTQALSDILCDLDALEPSDAELIVWGMRGMADESWNGPCVVPEYDADECKFELWDAPQCHAIWDMRDPVPPSARAILLEAWRKEQGHGS